MINDFAQDDLWYELYKSVTSEKDMAEKDQQKLVRRERRKIKRKKKLREERLRIIGDSLKIRANKRLKDQTKVRSTSADRYQEGQDHEYE